MGAYTEFVFQGEVRENIPPEVKKLFDYFFGDMEEFWGYYWYTEDKFPTFFKYFGGKILIKM